MSKKSTPEKGLPSVTIEFSDGPKTLKWNNEETRVFEEWILAHLDYPKTGLKATPTGIVSMNAEFAIMNFMATRTIQTRALYHSLRAESPDLTFSDVDNLITEYKASGKSYDDLLIAIQRAFLLANNPSILASQEANWKESRQIIAIQKEITAKTAAQESVERQKKMKEMEKKLAELASGETPPDSPTV